MADKLLIEIEAEDAVLERIHAALCAKIEPWLHCPFTVRLTERPDSKRAVKATKKPDA